ncbi:MAG: right-handed parallel beta-helix repeat-containing protein [Chloroflexaceae bacterium]|jgi:parallel beta-helix repeat protein|nr:right-handed parallel beta-helix repeat-containing protein [Chloroflexaceae bacterium]
MITPTDGLVITQNTTLAPGVYLLPQGLTIGADGVTLDGNGALLVGAGRQGRGLTLEGRRGVSVRNLRLMEYEHGIVARNCERLSISQCHVTATAEVPPNTIFLDIWLPAERAYGGGVLLHNVRQSRVEENDLGHQMNGLLCYDCTKLTVRRNQANYCSGFGFHFFNSSDCLVEENGADYCCRYYRRDAQSQHLGADAAAFLIAHGSCRNVFRRNMARLGGDGFFLAGLRPDWVHVPCNDNLFEENDGSYSPNIAFEATFSSGNTYRRNLANYCSYGFWLGFSAENVLEANDMRHNHKAGIAVENGYGMRVRHNRFESNSYGVLLWSKHVAAFAGAVPQNDTSRDWLIEENEFRRNEVAVRIAADQDHGVRPLPIATPRCPRPHGHRLRRNSFVDNRVGVETIDADDTMLEDNQMVGNVEADTR